LPLRLPLGVSFVIFTLTAYIVDIYRGKISGANAAVDRPRLRAVLSAPDRPPNLAAD
jgi:D-alanyl-lipoteichoic acid acyltransferase DltB (MBOAT superfamily)